MPRKNESGFSVHQRKSDGQWCARIKDDHDEWIDRRIPKATGVPMAFGVLTTLTEAQAVERSRSGPGNKGREAAAAALEMAALFRKLDEGIGG